MTKIFSTFTLEGFHCWPAAPDQVSFLRVRHRHLFWITVEVDVLHDDRNVEFITLGRELRQRLVNMYGEPAEFESLSCEAIAHQLLRFDGRLSSVRVSEDNENGAVAYKEATK